MKPNTTIPHDLLRNDDHFKNEFFQRYEPKTKSRSLQLTDAITKTYRFPTLYADVTCAIGIFLCSYDKAAKMTPHPKIKPVKMTKGRSLVIFSCYEYRNVREVQPYNEIAMTIPVMVDAAVNVPVLPMLLPIFSKFGYYVFSMPVTSLENRIRGNNIWGLPKIVREIDIAQSGGDCVTVGKEEDGKPYFELRVPMAGKKTHFDVASNLYSRLDNNLFQSTTAFKADFNVNKYMKLLVTSGVKPDREYLKIGSGPSAQALRDLDIDPHPFQFRYATGMSACFDLPNKDYQSPIHF